jgi:predicted lipid-binding transport protein (Tim44 family)
MQIQKWIISAVAAVALTTLAIGNVDAKRLGGSKSVGKQNSSVNKETVKQTPPPAASPAAPSAASPAAPATPPAAAPARNRWLGPLAGLAAGLGLAALASHLGMGEGFANIMMMVLFGMIALFAIRFFMAKRAAKAGGANSGLAGAFAGGAPSQTNSAFETLQPAQSPQLPTSTTGSFGETAPAAPNQATWTVPVGFDVDGFIRNARVHYIRMQGANDTGNLADLREFTSNELFAELSEDIRARQGQSQTTEIVSLNSQLVHFEQVAGVDHASVRYTGVIREAVNAPADSIDEVWNLQRPSDASKGWVVAGIQQLE